MPITTAKNTFSLQDTYPPSVVSELPPPPSYNFDEEERNGRVFEDDKRLRAICQDSNHGAGHQNVNAASSSQAPAAPIQAVLFEEEFYESRPFHQRRVCCLSLFWFAVICDICATAVALIGTLGATLTCRADCENNCNAICNPKSAKGLIASIVIFVILSSAILVGKLACCCSSSRRSRSKSRRNGDNPSTTISN